MKLLIMVIPIVMCLKLEHCKLHKDMCYQTKCDVINDVKLFPTVYPISQDIRTLSDQTSRYKSKCIRIYHGFMLYIFKKLFSLYSAAFDLGHHYLSKYLHCIHIFEHGLGLDIDTL